MKMITTKVTLADYKAIKALRHKSSAIYITYNREFIPDHQEKFYSPDKWRWVEHPSNGLRFVGRVSDIKGDNTQTFHRALVDHNGWYMDSYQFDLAWGEVYQLPARNGRPQYIPGICSTWDNHKDGNDAAILCFGDVTSDLRQAIYTADSMAEHLAESNREYLAKGAAEQQINDLDEEISQAKSDFKALAIELRANQGKITSSNTPAICRTIKQEFSRVRRLIRKARKRQARLREDFWQAVPMEGRY